MLLSNGKILGYIIDRGKYWYACIYAIPERRKIMEAGPYPSERFAEHALKSHYNRETQKV